MLVLNKKSIIAKVLTISFILLILLSSNCFAVVKPTTDFYVNDYASLLNPETKSYIINANKKLNSQTGSQIVVVTVPSLDGKSLEEYSTELFREFGIGDKTKNNGVLLLLALQERQFRIEVGYGLEGVLTDGKTGRIQDEYIIPYLKQDDWNEGIKNGFNAILNEISNEYNVEVGVEKAVVGRNSTESLMSFCILGVLCMSIFFNLIFKPSRREINKKWKIVYIFILVIFCYYFTKSILYTIIFTTIGWVMTIGGNRTKFLWRRSII